MPDQNSTCFVRPRCHTQATEVIGVGGRYSRKRSGHKPDGPGVSIVKVLIAEDDPFFRRLLQQVLASECEVVTAEDGTVAWAVLQQIDMPILAVLDWVMPGMAGPQLCREARANPATAGAYLILLTGKNSSADILAGLRAGADDYVTKPFEPEELRAR